jgi:hypothetical protein
MVTKDGSEFEAYPLPSSRLYRIPEGLRGRYPIVVCFSCIYIRISCYNGNR